MCTVRIEDATCCSNRRNARKRVETTFRTEKTVDHGELAQELLGIDWRNPKTSYRHCWGSSDLEKKNLQPKREQERGQHGGEGKDRLAERRERIADGFIGAMGK